MIESFNLVDEAWIPVLTRQGGQQVVSLATALRKAGDLMRIAAELPTVSIAIQRLLQAVLLRALQPLPRTREARARLWGEWWQDHAFPTPALDAYLGTWRENFDLWDEEKPFFQVPGITLKAGVGSGLSKLMADVPAGTKFFTTRSGKALAHLPYAEAAAWLVHAQAFDCAGIKSGVEGDARVKSGKNYSFGYPAWSGTLGLISLEGASLFETLMLNLDLSSTNEQDAPPWETAPQRVASDAIYPAPLGAAQAWTWPSRMIRLMSDGTAVTDVVLSNGERLEPANRFNVEPMTSWKHSPFQTKKLGVDTFMPVGHDPSRAAWRGLAGLLAQSPSGSPEKRRAAGVIEWLGILRNEEAVPDDLNLRVRCVSMLYGPQASTFDQDFNDEIPLSVTALTTHALRLLVVDAVEATRLGVLALRDFARNIALASGDSGDGVNNKIGDTEMQAFDLLRAPFERWLGELKAETEPREAAAKWQKIAEQTICQVASDRVKRCPDSAVVGRTVRLSKHEVHMDVGLASLWLSSALQKALPLAYPTISTKDDRNDI